MRYWRKKGLATSPYSDSPFGAAAERRIVHDNIGHPGHGSPAKCWCYTSPYGLAGHLPGLGMTSGVSGQVPQLGTGSLLAAGHELG